MGDQSSTSSLPPSSSSNPADNHVDVCIPAPLKFLVSNITNFINHPLNTNNYAIWRIQILQQFSANGYAGHLTGAHSQPSDESSQESVRWRLIDSNLISALFSTISPSILPYVITATTSHEIWHVLERRLQPSSRSRVLQLKNELHHLQMNNLTMQHYLSQIKNIGDNITAAGSKIDPEDIVLYILNGLPSNYNSFKTAVRTSPLPADLDKLYSLLCSKEIHVNQDIQKDQSSSSSASALYATSSNQSKG
ncbi:hypothetical protein KFK09_006870 [Dendrobium nobile]|uniref:Retrovirus-related Pol polyprotein from transposon TNT 1-94 n=1 Tax=Dendrobium nobile TaxID=94219 RepID=A0A8T3BV87_DENNO|nr:hypothetical protein KFK09_006870 [Dendrobium nobile]